MKFTGILEVYYMTQRLSDWNLVLIYEFPSLPFAQSLVTSSVTLVLGTVIMINDKIYWWLTNPRNQSVYLW